jgi:hypothetical protein
MRDVDCETVKGNMRIVYIRHMRRCMRDVDCETVKGNMRIVYAEKLLDMYEGCVDCETVTTNMRNVNSLPN